MQGMLQVTKLDVLAFATLRYLVWVLLQNLINHIVICMRAYDASHAW